MDRRSLYMLPYPKKQEDTKEAHAVKNYPIHSKEKAGIHASTKTAYAPSSWPYRHHDWANRRRHGYIHRWGEQSITLRRPLSLPGRTSTTQVTGSKQSGHPSARDSHQHIDSLSHAPFLPKNIAANHQARKNFSTEYNTKAWYVMPDHYKSQHKDPDKTHPVTRILTTVQTPTTHRRISASTWYSDTYIIGNGSDKKRTSNEERSSVGARNICSRRQERFVVGGKKDL
jgi:hypothetical protein